jgi:hypothetical protein
MKTLRESLGKPVLFHWVGWAGKNGEPADQTTEGYISTDPNVIAAQLDCMRAFGGDGAGVIALTYGYKASPFMHEASWRMGIACNAVGMPFALCYDPWTTKNAADKSQAMIDALKNPETQELLNMQCYLPGKPVLDFNTGANKDKVLAAVPGIQYWLKDVDYDWNLIPPKPNKTKLPSGYIMFDDGTGADRNKSCWNQSQPVRLVPSKAGQMFWSRDMSAGDYIQIVTWNDYHEQTAVEPWASLATGIRIQG